MFLLSNFHQVVKKSGEGRVLIPLYLVEAEENIRTL
jgi:hypothetical protein